MAQILVNRAELLPKGETPEEQKKWQEEDAALVEKDRVATGPNGGLFRGCFRRTARFAGDLLARQPIRDLQDGVERCPRCTWELEEGLCQSCGYPSGDDELSDSDAASYFPPDMYGDDLEQAALDSIDYEGHMYAFESENSPEPNSEEGYSSDEMSHTHYPPDPYIDTDPSARWNRELTPHHGDFGTLYDSTREETEENTEDDDAGSLDDFVVDDDEGGQHSPSSSVRSLQWETDNGSDEDDDTQTHRSENETDMDTTIENGRISINNRANGVGSVDEESDEGPLPPSRRQLAHRVAALNTTSSDDEAEPLAATRGHRGLTVSDQRPNTAIRSPRASRSQRTRSHLARPSQNDMPSSHSIPIEIDSDSDVPMPASRARRRHRNPQFSPAGDDVGVDDSNSTATVGRLSPRSRSIATTHSGLHALPQNTLTANSISHSRRQPSNQRRSPLPPSSHRHSPAAGPSHSSTPEEEQAQALLDRRAQKLERKAERRRLKAERERRRSAEATGSASPLRQSANA
ncbi:E3 ubiquitin ligase [Lecanora helva]